MRCEIALFYREAGGSEAPAQPADQYGERVGRSIDRRPCDAIVRPAANLDEREWDRSARQAFSNLLERFDSRHISTA
jgi:hypothetical protein